MATLKVGNSVVLVVFFLSNVVLAGASQSQTQKPPCLFCSTSTPANILSQPASADACEDLAQAACWDADGKSKARDVLNGILSQLVSDVKAAQEQGAKKMGANSLQDLLIKAIDKKGYKIKANISEEARKFIGGDYDNYVSAEDVFELSAQCIQDKKQIESLDTFNLSTPEQFKNVIAKIQEFRMKYREVVANFYANSIPDFVTKLNAQCNILERSKEELTKNHVINLPIVAKIKNICAHKKELREQAVRFYVKKDEPAVKQQLLAFIKENMDVVTANLMFLSPPNALNTAEGLREEARSQQMSISDVCSSVNERLQSGPSEIIRNTRTMLNTSRVVVETLFDKVYTQSRYVKAKQIFDRVKTEAYNFATQVTRDPKKLALIRDNYKRLQLTWLTKPADSAYEIDKSTGVQVLKLSPFDQMNIINQIFIGNLEFFVTINAFYLPDTSFGGRKSDLSVTIQPALIELIDQNPHAYATVLAHEVGHNIGPQISTINGYDLQNEFRPLTQCLSSSDSIRMNEDQADEVIADVVSSEVMGKLISEIPAQDRKAAVFASMQPFCKFIDDEETEMSLPFEENHPESTLRVSGIYGTNLAFRRALGCQQTESKNYRTCTLKGGGQ